MSLWEQSKADDSSSPIPLFVSLAQLEKPYSHAIEETLQKKGWDERDIAELKRQQRKVALLFDGFDELHTDKNLYQLNQIALWNAKMVITCRSQSWYLTGDYETLFAVEHHNRAAQRRSLEEAHLVGFNEAEIADYIVKYSITENSEWGADAIRYKQQIARVPNLRSALREPLTLRLLLSVLPWIVDQHAEIAHLTMSR